MSQTNALISLHQGYGLGDAVQMSAVLRHVAAAHPDWRISFQAEEGRHQVGRGIVADTFTSVPITSSVRYDFEIPIILYNNWVPFTDRPSTHVPKCLRDTFNLPWKPEFGRYVVNVSGDAYYRASIYLLGLRPPVVAIHHQGKTAKDKKDLTDTQLANICKVIKRLGRTPLVLGNMSGSAEKVCAVISQCEAFVGIDSGPAKCASATNTPSLVVWTGHHPAQFHDPAPNTTHLVPVGYHNLKPVCNSFSVVKWFEQNYNFRFYLGDPVGTISRWLRETLR